VFDGYKEVNFFNTTVWKALNSKLILEFMTQVSPANNISSDIDLILRVKSFIHIMTIKAPGIDPSGIPCSNVHQ